MTEFADLFSALEDPRASNARRHSFHDILVIAFCTMLCGGQTCTDMELFGHAKRELLQSFLKLENGIPSHDTFSRLWGMLDPFAGCATTPIAAQNLGRRSVGIDRREDAAYHVANRLLDLGINVNEFKAQHQALMPEIQAACEIRYIPPARTDDGESAPHLGPVYRRRQPATMTRAAMMAIITAQWGIRCWGCGFEPPSVEFFELDHIRPASEGGSNELENRAPLCGPCNKRKSNTMTLTALRRDNRSAGRWYGHPDIEQRIDLRLAGQWALDYLAQQRNPPETAAAS